MSQAILADAHGAAFPASGEILLNGEARAWRIEAGAVDVFSVWLRDGAPAGAREHLTRLEAGRSFCGLRPAPEGIALIAVASPGAALAEIPLSRDSRPPPAWFSDWLYELEAAAAGRPGRGREDADLEAVDADLLEQISAGRGRQDTETVQRMAERARTDERAFRGAIDELARVLTGDSDGPALMPRTGDALADACGQVFRAAGIPPGPGDAGQGDPTERLERLARQAGVGWRTVELEGAAWWTQDTGPLLAFRRDGAPVALIPRRRGGLWVVDPAADAPARLDAKAAAGLQLIAYTFYRALPDEQIGLMELVRFALRGTGPDLRRLLGLGALGGLLGLGVPMATGFLINTIIPANDAGQLWQVILLLLTTTIGVSAFELTRSVALLRVDARMSNAAQAAIMQRVLRLPAPFFRDFAVGDLAQRIFGVTNILQLVSQAAQLALMSWIFSLASFAYLFLVDWCLGLVVGGLVSVALAVALGLNILRLRLERRMMEAQGEIASKVFQILTGIGKIRANGAERRAFSLWATRFARQKTLDFGIRRIANSLEVFNGGYVVLASLCLFGAVAILAPEMPMGAFAAFNAAFSQFFASTLAMTVAVTAALHVIPLYERSRPVLHALPEPNKVQAAPRELTGAIQVSRVTFHYDEQGPPVLDDVSLSIRPGEFVAVVGPSASGKSTLFRLLLGFERPQSGAIYYDGQDAAGLDLPSLRRQLGVVLQNGKLMPGPIHENIGGAAQLSLDDAWAAARLAGLEAEIQAMPMGMHTVVAEGAGTISGGQRQRLMIARAVAGRPRILLFDEATSALDNASQALVTESLKSLDATRIVIAHRLSTILEADRIVVLEAGRVVEMGDYAELMARNGRFAELARRQIA